MSEKVDRRVLDSIMQDVRAAYPFQPLPDYIAGGIVDYWCGLAQQVGLARLEAGIRGAVAKCRYFPKGEDVESMIPAAPPRQPTVDPDCTACHGSGWKRSESGKGVVRCKCGKG